MNKSIFVVGAVFIALIALGCSSEDSPSAPTPTNQAPTIVAISATPNPVPRNRPCSLSATGADSNGDSLQYSWTATAGTFSTGSTSAQVTWVPPQTVADYSLTVSISDSKSSVDTTISITVGKAVYDLSGEVRNQAGEGAAALYVVITDSDAGVDSVLTDANGSYTFTEKPEGATSVTLRSAAVAFNRLPRYIQKDTTVSLTNTAVVNLGVQELQAIYDDDGTNSGLWTMFGGVRTDSTKYIFEDAALQSDHMVMTAAYLVPSYAQDIGILVHGVASPSDSGLVRTTIYKDGVNVGEADEVYYTSGSWMWVTLSSIGGLPSSNLHLDLEFFTFVNPITYPATSVSIDTILIYNY